jgi:hypothetical protein
MRVREDFGSLTPANVVEAARADDSPLHSRFEWDDSIAAESYRRNQASDLIRKVKVTYTDSSYRPQEVRAFLAVHGEESTSKAYEPTEDVLADPFTSKLVLQEFEREWKAFRARYEHFQEFRDVILAAVKDVAA